MIGLTSGLSPSPGLTACGVGLHKGRPNKQNDYVCSYHVLHVKNKYDILSKLFCQNKIACVRVNALPLVLRS